MASPLRRRLLPVLRPAAAALLLAAAAAPAGAASISSVSAVLGGTNSAQLFNDFAQTSEIGLSSVAVTSSDAVSFNTRYALAVGTDIGNANTLTVNHTASYTITFAVAALPIEVWQVDVTSFWSGALTAVNDGNGPATVTLNGVTGTHGGAGTLSGSLDLAAVGTLSTNTGGDVPFFATQLGQVTGTGAGTVTLSFTWTSSSTSTRVNPGGNNRGDEGALRMGIQHNMSSFTADNYGGPNPPARVLNNDGHFVNATLTTLVPEPQPMLLALAGIGGLALFGVRRPARRKA